MPPPWTYPTVANVAWILDDFTASNGATVIVPGSHVHGTHPDYANPPETVPVIARAGSAMVFDGRLWHGAAARTAPTGAATRSLPTIARPICASRRTCS